MLLNVIVSSALFAINYVEDMERVIKLFSHNSNYPLLAQAKNLCGHSVRRYGIQERARK